MIVILTLFSAVIEDRGEKALHDVDVELHPPVPPFRIALVKIVVRLDTMVHRIRQTGPGREDIHGVADSEEDLVRVVWSCIEQDEGVVRLRNPDSVVPDPLALEALDLQ